MYFGIARGLGSSLDKVIVSYPAIAVILIIY